MKVNSIPDKLDKELYGDDLIKIYGPYIYSGRRQVVFRYARNNRKSGHSYARYVMERYLGERLDSLIDVHHINGNKLDDRIENYEVISRADHARLHVETVDRIELSCWCCGRKVYRTASELQRAESSGWKKVTCSLSCAASKFKMTG